MQSIRSCGTPDGLRRAAFTLVEIVVALTIIAVLAAVAIPVVTGLMREERERAVMTTLAEMVLEARSRAMREQRPWQIVFEREGIHACQASFPYAKREDFIKHLEELRAPPVITEIEREVPVRTEGERTIVESANPGAPRALQPEPAPPPPSQPPEPPWTLSIPLEAGTECEVLLWGDGEPERIEGDRIRRWVFQPTGMASPARVTLRTGSLQMEMSFDALTGEVVSSKTWPLASLSP